MSNDGQTVWPTESGFIRKGMTVIDPEGMVLGVVDSVEGQEVLLAEPGHPFITVSEIDGIDGDRVLLSPRGDATFGLGAQP